MNRLDRSRILLIGALVGTLLFVASGEVPARAAAPSVPTNPSAAVSGSTATITWTAPLGTGSPSLMFYEITATDTTGGGSVFFGEEWACGVPGPTCTSTSVEWPGLVAGHTYTFAIRAVNSANEESPAAITAAVTVPSVGCAPSSTELCVAVDATDAGAPNRFVGAGLLHGVTSGSEPPYATYVQPLNLQGWRVDPATSTGYNATLPYIASNNMDVTTQALLQSAWLSAPRLTRPCNALLLPTVLRNPWNDYNYYRNWLYGAVADEANFGYHPDYWDIMNEVNLTAPFHSTINTPLENLLCPDVITAQKLSGFLLTSLDVLHSLSEKAVAASWYRWDRTVAFDAPDPDSVDQVPHVISLERLLRDSDGANLAWDGISYHEILGQPTTGSAVKDYRTTPRAMITNASQARALIANHPLQAGAGLFINEYFAGALPTGHYNDAGKVAAWFWAASLTDPVQANRSCAIPASGSNPGVTDCNNDSLDGLLNTDGNGNYGKRSAWYVFEAYGRMAGNLVETASNEVNLYGLSAFDDDNDVVRVLVGRHNNLAVDAAADTIVRVTPPAGFGTTLTVAIEEMGDNTAGLGTVSAPTPSLCDVTVSGGVAEIPIDDFPDNYAYLVTVTPATPGAPNAAC